MIQVSSETLQNVKHSWRLAKPFITPVKSVQRDGVHYRLWVSSYKLPALITLPPRPVRLAAVAPVAPDLKMVFGAAKLVRDLGADRVQYEAMLASPLLPGAAFAGTGARYKFAKTMLAVILDEYKQLVPSAMGRSLRKCAELARQSDCTGLIVPDFTANLIVQPNWLTEQQRKETAEQTALLTLEALKGCKGLIEQVELWCWEPENAFAWQRELERI